VIGRDLELFFKPKSKAKPQHFYGLKEGQSETIKMKFESNPVADSGSWRLAGIESEIAIGAASVDDKFQSGFVQNEVDISYTFTIV
jgi:hypothetical protein